MLLDVPEVHFVPNLVLDSPAESHIITIMIMFMMYGNALCACRCTKAWEDTPRLEASRLKEMFDRRLPAL